MKLYFVLFGLFFFIYGLIFFIYGLNQSFILTPILAGIVMIGMPLAVYWDYRIYKNKE